MKPSRRRPTISGLGHQHVPAEPSGPARIGKRTKDLTKRLVEGDIAIINHADLDTVAADALVSVEPAAVLNAAKSTTGRYPNAGPGILLEAEIPLIDDLGPGIMDIPEGATVTLAEGTVLVNGAEFATGVRQTAETIAADQTAARDGLAAEMVAFADNTATYVQQEKELLLEGIGVPDVRTKFEGRHALVVVRGHHYKDDLAMLAPYIRENKPILIGVDGGADAILDAGYHLDMIVGDMDSVSEKALTSGAEVVVHAYRDGKAPGAVKVRELGVEPVIFSAAGTSEDIAMILADDHGAELIVGVGTHTTLVEYLDKGRAGMASTFLTRLRIGTKLVDAKGVSLLYRTRISSKQLTWLSGAGIAAVIAALWATDIGQAFFGIIGARLDMIGEWFTRLFGG
ncbi:MAG: hypothetical protein LBH13_01610 [Cellulomonadaceae bacterium]|jgi:uncharacterized membrane-anchored protein|nr:hypothetical protein [Cellulomonadaceae bacterium]